MNRSRSSSRYPNNSCALCSTSIKASCWNWYFFICASRILKRLSPLACSSTLGRRFAFFVESDAIICSGGTESSAEENHDAIDLKSQFKIPLDPGRSGLELLFDILFLTYKQMNESAICQLPT